MTEDRPHPIIDRPYEYAVASFRYEVAAEDPFIDLTLTKEGERRTLRFFGPRNLSIEQGFPEPTGGMQILDVKSRQMQGIGVWVADFEGSWGAITFFARKVVEIDSTKNG